MNGEYLKPSRRRSWVALPLALLLAGCSEKPKVVVQVESEKEANEILVALGDYSPQKDSQKSGQSTVYEIKVESGDFQEALEVLLANNLPRNSHGGFEAMMDSAGLIPTRTDERARFLHAREQELEESLELIDGVMNARVHLVMPEKDRYETARSARESTKGASGEDDSTNADAESDPASLGGPSASVVLRYDPSKLRSSSGASSSDDLEARVSRVVASAVENLDHGRVEVFMQPAQLNFASPTRRPVDPADPNDSPAGRADPAADSAAIKAANDERDDAKRDRNYAILASVALAVLLLFALVRSMKRR